MSPCSFRRRTPESRVNITSPMSHRSPPIKCWRGERWRKVSWRRGTKVPLSCLFAACRVRVADGPKHRFLDKGVERMPGEEVWIVGERRSSGEQKYYISKCSRMAQICFGLNGGFAPMMRPTFQGAGADRKRSR